MKRVAALLMFIMILSCIAALANSVPDPKIIIKDPLCGTATCTSVGTHFTFTSPTGGSGTLFFTNSSGSSWHSLELIESGVPASAITCDAPHTFMSCTKTTVGGVTTILLSGIGGSFSGIPVGHNFSITFGQWPAGGVNFKAMANVPEPATLALFLTGLGALATRRKKLLPPL
jgi:hypothetical protein